MSARFYMLIALAALGMLRGCVAPEPVAAQDRDEQLVADTVRLAFHESVSPLDDAPGIYSVLVNGAAERGISTHAFARLYAPRFFASPPHSARARRPSAPCSTRSRMERHGDGYAIYVGRDDEHHGYNIAHVTDLDDRYEARLVAAVNVLPALLAELRAARELEAALARLDDADRGVIERLSDGDWFCPTSASGPRAPTLRALLLALGAER